MRKPKVLIVFGTRPEAIKMAPVVAALKDQASFLECTVAVTAQHREMLDQVLSLFQIEVKYDLDLMRPGQSVTEVTSRVLFGMERVYHAEKPDLVLVHGDTTTTLACALAAFYQKIAVGHVEAGLRTQNKYAPYPEEMNRRLTAGLADLHFAPTQTAKENLLREGVPPENIYVTGNTVIDALFTVLKQKPAPALPFLKDFDCRQQRLILVTAHRRENWGVRLENIFGALCELVNIYPDLHVVFPVHKNPRVSQAAWRILGECPRIKLLEPLAYLPFVQVMAQAYLVLTDSGGLQEEAPSLGKPVLVLRETTERPEAIVAGTVKLVGTSSEKIIAETRRLLDDPAAYAAMANAVNPYGDGQAAPRIAACLKYYFGFTLTPPEEFSPR